MNIEEFKKLKGLKHKIDRPVCSPTDSTEEYIEKDFGDGLIGIYYLYDKDKYPNQYMNKIAHFEIFKNGVKVYNK